jgi:hypothetical protein
MAILVRQIFPEGTTIEFLDEVTEAMGVRENYPPGGVVHVHWLEDGRVHGVDVWDSAEAYHTFVNERLLPAAGKVAEGHGLSMDGVGPEETITEVATMVRA